MSDRRTFDAVVIGGGAIGCTTAYFLCREGLRVALFDKGDLAREASWASAGMIGPASAPAANPWYLASTTRSKALYDDLDARLFEETGRRIGYGGHGMLIAAVTEAEAMAIHPEVAAQTSDGVAAHHLTGEEAREREPALPETVIAAAWKPDGRFLDARTYTEVVAVAAIQKGLAAFPGRPVTGFVREGETVTGVHTTEGAVSAPWVINAAGAWAGRIDAHLTHPVYPLHGQILSLSGPQCGLRHNVMRAGTWGYATPRADGRVLIGATEDEWGYQKKITPDGLALLGQIAHTLLPSLATCRVLDIWSGLRPATPDGLPTLGPDPRVSGGYLWAAGHTACGMMQTPATAEVLTNMVLGKPPGLPIDNVRIDRFLDP